MDILVIPIIILWLAIVIIIVGYPGWVSASLVMRQTAVEMSHPPINYEHIATMERAIWGQTFHTYYAAGGSCACDTCTKRYGRPAMYSNRDLVRPQGPPPGDWHDWEA